jgi:predicted GIY-YIG superfamily endonuclease
MAFVYLVQCRDGSLYCGWAVDPVARAAVHNAGKGATYTRSRRPVRLVWCEACTDKRAALRREYAIKRLTRAHKLRLIALNPPSLQSAPPAASAARE